MVTGQLKQRDFYKIIETEDSCLEYLKHKDLIGTAQPVLCEKYRNGAFCGSPMREVKKIEKNGSIRTCFRCPKRGCQTTMSIRRTNQFFTYTDLNGRCNSRLPLSQILELVWFWLNFVKTVTAIKHTYQKKS